MGGGGQAPVLIVADLALGARCLRSRHFSPLTLKPDLYYIPPSESDLLSHHRMFAAAEAGSEKMVAGA